MLRAKPKPCRVRRLPGRLLRTPEAARFVGLSIRTLEKHRGFGTGGDTSSSVVASSTDLAT